MNPFLTWYRGLPPVLRALITVNVVMYALFLLVFQWSGPLMALALRFLALNPTLEGVLYAPWTVLTYAVSNFQGSFWGLLSVLFNMLFLYWIGEEMERMLGGSWLLVTYFASALGGVLGAFAYAALVGPPGPYAGASPAVLGVMMATATRYPDRQIGLLFIGVVRLVYVVIGFVLLSLLLNGRFGVYLFAIEVGGVLAAFLMASAEKRGADLHSWADVFTGRRRRSSRPRTAPRPQARVPRFETVPAAPRRATQDEVDRILDKISAQGRDALTAEERRILDEYSRR